jgi:hypothetical protein
MSLVDKDDYILIFLCKSWTVFVNYSTVKLMTIFVYLKWLFSKNVDPMKLWEQRYAEGQPKMCICGVVTEDDMVAHRKRTSAIVDKALCEQELQSKGQKPTCKAVGSKAKWWPNRERIRT